MSKEDSVVIGLILSSVLFLYSTGPPSKPPVPSLSVQEAPKEKKGSVPVQKKVKAVKRPVEASVKPPETTKIDVSQIKDLLAKNGVLDPTFSVSGDNLIVGGNVKKLIFKIPFKIEYDLANKAGKLSMKIKRMEISGSPASRSRIKEAQKKTDARLAGKRLVPGTTLIITDGKKTLYQKRF